MGDCGLTPRRQTENSDCRLPMATTDRTRLDELTQMVQAWVWALYNPSATDFVRRANLDVVRNQIHRERTALIERGVIDKWTMDWSEGFVLPKLDELVSDRDNKRGIFAVSNYPVWYKSSPDTEGGPFWFRGGIETKSACPVPGCGADFLDEWYSDPGDPEARVPYSDQQISAMATCQKCDTHFRLDVGGPEKQPS